MKRWVGRGVDKRWGGKCGRRGFLSFLNDVKKTESKKYPSLRDYLIEVVALNEMSDGLPRWKAGAESLRR